MDAPQTPSQPAGALGGRAVAAADDRERLLALIRETAVVHGRVTLSSGAEADYYVDLRRITLHHEAAPLVGRVMLDLVDGLGLAPDAVGGLTMGADPVAGAMLHAAAAEGRALDAFVVRKQGKAHGLQRQVEGPAVEGRRVVAVEDTMTTGGSVMTAVEALRAHGAEVLAVAVLVDRDTGARERIEAEGLDYLAVYGLDELGLGQSGEAARPLL
ncbi:orotate phosphoribosyltransferase [Pseudokineococcus lusitanus]|uniref:Orotate phosphoribosyltransferase n=1 Tax=Pseudokineococcus lusitanus TaxID=763993 RepID=A0A3N1GAJ4_9ACTN|nr:orotate phosphoribosyltransferase [Pseudokineococcus lusitanus]ROP27257.1 orotate phosphoribosyltransferase [Pseudokineococcus lusitanus]